MNGPAASPLPYGPAAAHHYELGRPDFPLRTVMEILRVTGLSPPIEVADIGSGTGKLARLFRGVARRVHAVEPLETMREKAESLLGPEPWYQAHAAQAENTGLERGSVDLIVCGRSLHWFDHGKAASEFRRILRPNGWLVIAGMNTNRLKERAIENLRSHLFGDNRHPFEDGTPRGIHHAGIQALYFGKRISPVTISETIQLDHSQFISYLLGCSLNRSDQSALTDDQSAMAAKVFEAMASQEKMSVSTETKLWIGRMG